MAAPGDSGLVCKLVLVSDRACDGLVLEDLAFGGLDFEELDFEELHFHSSAAFPFIR
jgi:hypothetical protein